MNLKPTEIQDAIEKAGTDEKKPSKVLDNRTPAKRSFAERPGYFRGAKVRTK